MFKEYTPLPRTVWAVRFTERNKDQVFNSLVGRFAAAHEDGKLVLKVETAKRETVIVRIGDWVIQETNALGCYYSLTHERFIETFGLKNPEMDAVDRNHPWLVKKSDLFPKNGS